MPAPNNPAWINHAPNPNVIAPTRANNERGHRLPEASRATRKVSFRSRTSVRGMVPVWIEAQQCIRRIFFESKLELVFIMLAMTSGRVVDLWEQPPAVVYKDVKGKERKHTFDFLITMADGQRYAVAVRPQERVEARSFDIELSMIKSQLPATFADEVILFTDINYTAAEASNALRFHELTKQPDPEADEAVHSVARYLNGAVSIAEFCAITGLSGRAYRAAFRAIMSGILKSVSSGPIELTTVVMKGDAV